MTQPPTWHHGLVADWWAEFNVDGPEIEYFGRFVEHGQPALDAGCGAGRLLLPWLRAGFDVDGCDVSADMIDRCREKARRDSLDPALYVQALHALDLPRRYRTIVVCGVFGLGSTRAQDEEALRRLHRLLEPGGILLLDNEVPFANARRWRQWTKEERKKLPEPWPADSAHRTTDDGREYVLRTRALEVDPLDQSLLLELHAEKWQEGACVADEHRRISIRSYFRDELLLLLDRTGFTDVDVRAGYRDEPPTADDDFLVFVATA